MRISDWSSDVCSSDLPYLGLPERIASGKPVGGEIGGKRAAIDPRGAERGERGGGVALCEPFAVRAANERVVAIERRRQAAPSLEQPMNVDRRDQVGPADDVRPPHRGLAKRYSASIPGGNRESVV